jgi:hypothetical protein
MARGVGLSSQASQAAGRGTEADSAIVPDRNASPTDPVSQTTRRSMLPVPREEVIFRRLGDGAVVYHCTDEVYFGLNAGGARVWELLPPVSGSLDELVDRIARENPDADATTIRRDAEAMIAAFERFNLVRAA